MDPLKPSIVFKEQKKCSKCGRVNKTKAKWCKSCRSQHRKNKRQQDPVLHWAKAAVRGAKRRTGSCSVTAEQLKSQAERQQLRCCYCSRAFQWFNRRSGRLSPTVDKVVPDDGYKIENILIACRRCNRVKSDASLQELKGIVKGIEKWKQS